MAESIRVVGILSPGGMGAAVGRLLAEHGLRVVTCLQGRSERTRRRARQAGMDDLPSYQDLAEKADVLLSILPPAQALPVAQEVARALERGSRQPQRRGKGALVYGDCNAVSPQTVREIARTITGAGGEFLDAAIIGGPPTKEAGPRIYVSGPQPQALAELARFGLDIRVLGKQVGQASGLKMVYAASTKGAAAVWLELLVAAEALGLADTLRQELQVGQPEQYRRMQGYLPTVPRRAGRWIGEMEEVAATFQALGLTPWMLRGAAEMYRLVAECPVAEPERASSATMAELLLTLSQRVAPAGPDS
jgi:3-hydroxyisobutyrate dehydrogenase-like beta-hydroxyacid dehydrogenase